MACPDLPPSHGFALDYSPGSRRTSGVEGVAPKHDASVDPCSSTAMTEPPYDSDPATNDGRLCQSYPGFYDFSNTRHYSATSADSGPGGGQPAAGLPQMCDGEGGYQDGWQYGLGSAHLLFPFSRPDIARGPVGVELQTQAPWGRGAQAYTATVGAPLTMAEPPPQCVPVQDATGTWREPLSWPQQQMGQASPSPSISSYYASSPASSSRPFASRHNSCSSLPAARAAAVLRYVPGQAGCLSDGQLTPGGAVARSGLHAVAELPSSVEEGGEPRTSMWNHTVTTTTAATGHSAGTASPVVTPSSENGTAAVPYQAVSQAARRNPDKQARGYVAERTRQPAIDIAQQNWSTATGRTQGQQFQSRFETQTRLQGRPPPPSPTQQQQQQQQRQPHQVAQRRRNRNAANKCRAKTKLAVADLESTERAMSAENRELAATARGLRDEVLLLKNELLAHGNCDDAIIQQYLANQARMVGQGGPMAAPQQ